MTILEGKGLFIWRVRACENGDPQAIAEVAKAAGLTHVLLKVADGNFNYNIDVKTGEDLTVKVTKTLQANNIKVYGWHYVYSYDPLGEANRAIQRVQQLNLDGYVIDAEAEYKEQNRAARLYMDRLRSALPSLPIGLSSYRFPNLHPQIPWTEFLLKCDFNMPQVYWINAHNPGDQLIQCLQSFQKVTPFRPIIPTGASFRQGNWQPSIEDVSKFVETARKLNMPAVNFWEWSKVRNYLPEIWNWFAGYSWPVGTPVSQDITQKYIGALNKADLDQIMALYIPDAVHITDDHAFQGVAQIRSYYDHLLHQDLAQGVYMLANYSGDGSIRHMEWTATARSGSVHNGSDTLGLLKDKIAYHYSDYQIN